MNVYLSQTKGDLAIGIFKVEFSDDSENLKYQKMPFQSISKEKKKYYLCFAVKQKSWP